MNLIGKWKTKEILSFSAENGMEWKTLDELAAMGEDEDSLSPYRNSLIVFNEDGTMETLMPVPEDFTKEQIDALIAEGNEVRDGMAVIDKKKWKTEDGKNLCNSDVEGEIYEVCHLLNRCRSQNDDVVIAVTTATGSLEIITL